MSRRDTIIIAVLLNAALLVVLFMTAVQTESQPHIVHAKEVSSPPPVIEKKAAAKAPQIPQGGDTIDEVLNKYSEVLTQNTQKGKEPEKKEVPVAKVPPLPKVEKLPHEEPVKTITVVKGDVLEKIAKSHGVTVESIMKENNMGSSNLRIGQKLRIPRQQPKMVAAKSEKKPQGKFYVVKGGDNPWSIAKKNNIQVEDLLRLNNMDEAKAKRLRPGDRLRIE